MASAHETTAAPVYTAPVSRRPTCTHVRRRPYLVLYQSQVHLLLLVSSPHSTTTIPTSLCTEGRQQVATPPTPLVAVLVRHRCPESGLVHASSCTTAMCLQSTAVASTMGLAIERRLRPSSSLTATTTRSPLTHLPSMAHQQPSATFGPRYRR
jgi:hypothetical protein